MIIQIENVIQKGEKDLITEPVTINLFQVVSIKRKHTKAIGRDLLFLKLSDGELIRTFVERREEIENTMRQLQVFQVTPSNVPIKNEDIGKIQDLLDKKQSNKLTIKGD